MKLIIKLTKTVSIQIDDRHISAEADGHFSCISPDDAATDHGDTTWFNARYAT
ncbi:hypothetical protein D3C85_1810010 [compost metagenome]